MAVLDLVPHDLPRHIRRTDFENVIESADVIVGELRTIAPFFDTEENADGVARHLLTTNPRLTSILRYDDHNIGVNHILSQDSESIDRRKGSPGEHTKFGYGDRLMARQLAMLLSERS